jgi:hypothetical protein
MTFDEDGGCMLGFDDCVIEIEYQGQTESLSLRSNVCDIPATAPADYFAKILELNLGAYAFNTAFLAVDRIAGKVVLINHVALRGLDPALFEKFVSLSVHLVELWRDLLTAREFAVQPTARHLETLSSLTDGYGVVPIRV